MALVAGTRLGPYEIEAPLGAGGMGEVYRARDTRLDRTVAIKVLPSHLSGSSKLRQRFEHEARAISRLNHPHICTLHDVDLEGEQGFLVMEHLKGESLAARLLKGFLPFDEALQRADEILDALDAAHRAGIVHRDLKPGNVMLTAAGAKVLDFGLSRHHRPIQGSPDSERGNASGAETLTAAPTLTAAGTIVGTPPYMAPEQVQGRAVDTRADLFAFGALFFEMLIGQRAFNGNSTVAVVAAVLEREPPALSSLRPDLPVALDAIVKRCFAKDPDARWQSARDLRFALRTLFRATSPDLPLRGDPGSAQRSRQRERAVWAILVVGFAVTLGLYAGTRRPPVAPIRAAQLALPLPEDTYFPRLEVHSPLAVSPDGRHIAFVASSLGVRRLWVRRLDESASRLLAGTEGALSPFWSPDGRFLGYFAQGRMMKIGVPGGPAQLIHEGVLEGDAEWGEDGDILFAAGAQGIFRVSSNGGKPTQVTHLDPTREREQFWPRRLPGGSHILYLSIGLDPSGRKTRTLIAQDLATGTRQAIPEVGTRAAYVDGHLVYAQDGGLLARPFDAVTRRFTGDPVSLVEHLSHLQGSGLAEFSLASGTLAYHAGAPLARLVHLSRQGETDEIGEPAPFSEIRRSPDGRRLAVSLESLRTGSHDLWIYDATTGLGSRLTSDPADERSPVWSPDGQWIYYRSDAHGHPDIHARRADGSSQEKQVLSSDWALSPVDISPDGKMLFYEEFRRERGGTDLGVMSLADSSVRPFLQTPFGEHSARISPDGRWVAFVSDETGKQEIYVAPIGSGETRRRVSLSGGNAPRWWPDGRELLFATADATLMSVPIADASGEPIGSPRVLMRRNLPKQWGEFEFGPDGESIVAIRKIRDPRDEPIQIMLDWQVLAGR